MGYHDLDLISNSRLGVVDNLIHGRPLLKCKRETLEFGQQLHEAVLEQEKYMINLRLYPERYKPYEHKVKTFAASAHKNALLMYFLLKQDINIEEEMMFVDESTGLTCKMKADFRWKNKIGDLKSTDAKTREEFESRIIEYGYDRQGAFYLDGFNAQGVEVDEFLIFAVSKKYPHPTFTYRLPIDCETIIRGQQKYHYLIDEYIKIKDKYNFQQLMSA